jgi:hypothetical protein
VSAQVPAPDAVLEALVREALENNPDLRATEEALRAARQRPAQVSSLADPVLSVNYTNEGWSPSLGTMPDTNLAIMASQDLPFPGKRHLRAAIAGLEADQVDQQLARARLSLAAAVRRSYSGLLLSRALLALTTEQGELWKHTEGVVRARYGVGQGNQQDVLRTQVELTRVGQLVVEQETDIAIRRAEINRLLGRAADAPLATEAVLAAAPPAGPLAAELESARAASPEIAAARLAVERARLAVDLARKDFKPDFAVQGGYMNRGGLDPCGRQASASRCRSAGSGARAPSPKPKRRSEPRRRGRLGRAAAALPYPGADRPARGRSPDGGTLFGRNRPPGRDERRGCARQLPVGTTAVRRGAGSAHHALHRPRHPRAPARGTDAHPRGPRRGLPGGRHRAVSPGPLPSSPAGSMATGGSGSMGSMGR